MRLRLFPVMIAGLLLAHRTAGGAEAGAAETAKSRAYELYELKRYPEAAAEFKHYLEQNPDDPRVAFDYGSLLSELKRHDEAATVLESLHRKEPEQEVAYFRLGAEYVYLEIGRASCRERVETGGVAVSLKKHEEQA